jgi:hypothetical protein
MKTIGQMSTDEMDAQYAQGLRDRIDELRIGRDHDALVIAAQKTKIDILITSIRIIEAMSHNENFIQNFCHRVLEENK